MIESEACGQHIYEEPRPAFGYGSFGSADLPTVNDDEAHGYSVNSFWFKGSVPKRLFVCVSNLTGFAVWEEIPLSDGLATRAIFDRYTDATTTGTTRETLYADEVPMFVLYPGSGEKVFFRYAGTYASNANAGKYLFLEVSNNSVDTDISSSDEQAGDGTKWEIDGFVMRVSSEILRYEAEFTTSGVTPVLREGQITGLDLDGEPVLFNLDARTSAAAGDITATIATAWFIPAAPVETFYLLEGGDYLVESGDRLTY